MTGKIHEAQPNKQNTPCKPDSACYMQDSQLSERDTWERYMAGTLQEVDSLKLEEHLLSCESCLGLYLGFLEKELEDEEKPCLSEEFTDRVMEAVGQENTWQKISVPVVPVRNIADMKEKEIRSRRVNLFISYCAAAGIAMFFWVGGVFDGLSGSFSGTLSRGVEYLHGDKVAETKIELPKSLIQTGWTQKMLEEERPSFIKDFILKKE